MKKQLIFAGATLVTLAYLTACGDETTNVTETTGMSVVKKGDKTPDCTADNEGEMIYVADSAAAFYCADSKWQSLKGEQGEPGEGKQGPKGEDGVGIQGDPGAAGKSCTAQKLASDDGYKIVCGGDSVGVVMDGGGVDGTSCGIESVAGGVVTVKCGTGENAETTQLYKAFCNGTVYDPDSMLCDPRDYQLYRTVTIAPTGTNYSRTWMAQNLNYAYTAPTETLDSSSFCYDNDPANCAKYGRLYLWSAAMDSAGVIPGNAANGCGTEVDCTPGTTVRGVCPAGWHLPSKEEWDALIVAVDENITEYSNTNVAGKVLKSTTGWSHATGITNDDTYAFSALPAGRYNTNGKFNFSKTETQFWSSSLSSQYKASAYRVNLEFTKNEAIAGIYYKYCGFSVRCVKDSE